MNVSIKSEKTKIINSGSIIEFDDSPIIISFSRGKEKVNLELNFIKMPKEKGIKFESKGTRKNFTIILTMPRTESPLGEGFKKPQYIASFDNGDKLYLRLWSRLVSSSLEIIYTIYLEERKK